MIKAFVLLAAAALMVGCTGNSYETYKGPGFGKPCKELYELPANVQKCEHHQSGSGK
jgi:hypothetical protein